MSEKLMRTGNKNIRLATEDYVVLLVSTMFTDKIESHTADEDC